MSETNKYTMENLREIVDENLKKLEQDDKYYYLYKYMSFDNDMLVLNIFDNAQLKYTKPQNFNDPYDCGFLINVDFTNFNKSNVEKIIRLKLSNREWLHNKNKIKDKFKTVFKDDFLRDYRNQIAVTCYTTNPLNILMWSHYARNHTGFVIEFKYPKQHETVDNVESFDMPFPVLYTEKYPVISLNWNFLNDESIDEPDSQADLIAKMVLTKAKFWSYENEFRSILFSVPKDENIVLRNIDPKSISNIIVGSNISKKHLEQLTNSIIAFNKKNQSKVGIYHSDIMNDRYELYIPQFSRFKGK